ELAPETPGLDGPLMPVPGQALDADHGEVAAEAPEPFQQGDFGAGPRRRDRRGQAAGAAADDEHPDAVHDVDRARRLVDSDRYVAVHAHQCRGLRRSGHRRSSRRAGAVILLARQPSGLVAGRRTSSVRDRKVVQDVVPVSAARVLWWGVFWSRTWNRLVSS